MALYGIEGSHTTESCPLNNNASAKAVLQTENIDMSEIAQKYKINKIVGQFHSALEHTFLWVLDAEDPHLIQQFCIDAGVASFNAVKIIPLKTYDEVIEAVKKGISQ
ncbi:MAG: hypothetical protein GWN01_05975 [Nitrosopumilaceae archaeon]|nr:hypothetical protein [Nitrosopumilaceae archaeon]NIU00486.1 hypothetical protein [Nitrosopumilaceae archaeon]NIU86869.1 hypothetical protein [Nitrosopumilaceae archaeon]NIV65549.1 hypothetical protein [Nitrosopumilaceae archaeon]NIX61088.1 hypothetical protein [Nitrosopumilaceae archaeon]